LALALLGVEVVPERDQNKIQAENNLADDEEETEATGDGPASPGDEAGPSRPVRRKAKATAKSPKGKGRGKSQQLPSEGEKDGEEEEDEEEDDREEEDEEEDDRAQRLQSAVKAKLPDSSPKARRTSKVIAFLHPSSLPPLSPCLQALVSREGSCQKSRYSSWLVLLHPPFTNRLLFALLCMLLHAICISLSRLQTWSCTPPPPSTHTPHTYIHTRTLYRIALPDTC